MDRLSDRENRQLSSEQRRRQESLITTEATATIDASRAYAGMAALMGSYFDAMVLRLRDFFTAEATQPNRRHTLYTLLQGASPEAIAHVTLRQIIRGLTGYERNGQKKDSSDEDADRSAILHTNVATKIGRALHQLSVAQQQLQPPIAWTERDYVKAGAKCLSLLETSTATPLFQRKTIVTGDKRQVSVLDLSPHALDWFSFMVERGAFAEDLPSYKPMVCPPKPWTIPTDGGYLTIRVPLVKVYGEKGRRYLADLKSVKMPLVYRALNALQAVPFMINTKVLEVAQKLSDGEVGCVPDEKRITTLKQMIEDTKTKALSKKPDSKEAKKLWREYYQSRREYAKLVGRKIQVDTIKKLAGEFAQEPEIFFPMNLDFRGRVNPLPVLLNPNGNDLAKSLLTFAKGKHLFADDPGQVSVEDFYLAIYGAGLYKAKDCGKHPGNKFDWTRKHKQQIFDCATDPLKSLWWTQASEPWRFLAFCFEYHAVWKWPAGLGEYISHLPIAIDGTCNGLQHYSLMLRNEHIAEAVNLKPSKTPQDIYQRVAEKMKSKFAMPDAPKLAKEWLAVGFDREATKKIVMAKPYGISGRAERQHIRKYLANFPSCPWKPNTQRRREAVTFFAQAVHNALAVEVDAADYAMKWLKSVARILSNNGTAIKWTSPAGLPVVQNYTEVDSYQIEVMLEDGKRYQPRLTKETNRLDVDKQCRGIAPNFIHSLDAAHLMLTINRALDDGITSFSTNHDCYSVVAQDHHTLFAGIRQSMIDCHLEPALEPFLLETTANLTPDQRRMILSLPPLGHLKIEEVREAFYAFSS